MSVPKPFGLVAFFAAVLLVVLFPALKTSSSREAPGRADLVGQMQTHTVSANETLLDIARDYQLGFVEVVAANQGIDPWVPGAGKLLVVPGAHILPDAPRNGIVVNLAELRLYAFTSDGRINTYPIGVGRLGLTTPVGQTRVIRKRANPTWTPTAATRADNPDLPKSVPPGPDNPLGRFAIDLGWPTYAIHGTNIPWGVGRRVSRGCIRMYPEHIEKLFAATDVGTKVTVVDQAVKVGWRDGSL